MIKNLKVVRINIDYCDFLRKFDNKVAYNKNEKELRPFVGILFKINEIEYFAPLSSPKIKHLKMKNSIDFIKIDDGKLGAVNFNNMIPVTFNNYEVINVNKKSSNSDEEKYVNLLKDQLDWLNKNYVQIRNKSYKLYNLYLNNRLSSNIKDRCCDFKLLEEKCAEYNELFVM